LLIPNKNMKVEEFMKTNQRNSSFRSVLVGKFFRKLFRLKLITKDQSEDLNFIVVDFLENTRLPDESDEEFYMDNIIEGESYE